MLLVLANVIFEATRMKLAVGERLCQDWRSRPGEDVDESGSKEVTRREPKAAETTRPDQRPDISGSLLSGTLSLNRRLPNPPTARDGGPPSSRDPGP